jgi:hypothetical protein
VVWTPCLLLSLQRPLIHLLGLVQLGLGGIEDAQAMKSPFHAIVYNHVVQYNVRTSSSMLEKPSLYKTPLNSLFSWDMRSYKL